MKQIRLRDVMDCTGPARSAIYEYISEGTFPKSVSLGSRVAAWVEIEVQVGVSIREIYHIKAMDSIYFLED
ncbi:transcriptional regulator [Shewanella algae]|nr:AlpA family phage regulatory protein [Shewanella algae]QGS62051.1 AlpA family phage regulatory protein [Shewanella algae]TVK92538.1 transcriptional regulator [Shewanella algae]UZD60579.1 AlpA family transcriptional regulator [Shewanella algae]